MHSNHPDKGEGQAETGEKTINKITGKEWKKTSQASEIEPQRERNERKVNRSCVWRA